MFRFIYKPSSDAGINIYMSKQEKYTKNTVRRKLKFLIALYIRLVFFKYFYVHDYVG